MTSDQGHPPARGPPSLTSVHVPPAIPDKSSKRKQDQDESLRKDSRYSPGESTGSAEAQGTGEELQDPQSDVSQCRKDKLPVPSITTQGWSGQQDTSYLPPSMPSTSRSGASQPRSSKAASRGLDQNLSSSDPKPIELKGLPRARVNEVTKDDLTSASVRLPSPEALRRGSTGAHQALYKAGKTPRPRGADPPPELSDDGGTVPVGLPPLPPKRRVYKDEDGCYMTHCSYCGLRYVWNGVKGFGSCLAGLCRRRAERAHASRVDDDDDAANGCCCRLRCNGANADND